MKNSRQMFRDGMRNAVSDQISEQKRKVGLLQRCPGCNTSLSGNANVEGDHASSSFHSLLVEFLGPEPWDFLEEVVYKKVNGRMHLSNDYHLEFLLQWKEFHHKKAKVVLLCRGCHDRKDRTKPQINTI